MYDSVKAGWDAAEPLVFGKTSKAITANLAGSHSTIRGSGPNFDKIVLKDESLMYGLAFIDLNLDTDKNPRATSIAEAPEFEEM